MERLQSRQTQLHDLLSDPKTIADQNLFRELSRELAEIRPVTASFETCLSNQREIDDIQEMMQHAEDSDIRGLAEEELALAEERQGALMLELQRRLLPVDPADKGNVFLEIRAGTGGEEAALFAGDLMNMYSHYVEQQHWTLEQLSATESELRGFREVILRVIGTGAYSRLKFESGVHRVQRVPETESQGRIHTSACTVAVLPEPDEITDVQIDASDLRIDTYRASGAGGQHVNKTDSAIRITHLPTGTVVECQDERSQHKNRARAMSLLRARLLDQQRTEQQRQQAENRRNLVGSGSRSERIRTYNFPQGRVTDHRINLTLYRLDEFISGNLNIIIEPLMNEYQADQLAALME